MDLTRMNLDLAAMRTLKLVHEQRSFTAAARALGVNQSAVSYTIEKSRNLFQDPLFVRLGGGIVPTDRCSEIVASVSEILAQFERLMQPADFDPATAKNTVVIACNYYERSVILPPVINSLRARAPGLRITLINSTDTGDQQLDQSKADILIGPLRPDRQGFFCRKLLEEHYVCVLDPNHPLAQKPLSKQDYLTCPHATITYGGYWQSGYLRTLEAEGLALNQMLTLQSPASLGQTLAGTDLIATVPARVAALMSENLTVTDCPIPAPFDIDLVWTTRTHHAPMFMWLRDLIFGLVQGNLSTQ